MVDSIIEGVRDYISKCPYLSEIAPKKPAIFIDWNGTDPDNYGIFPDGDVTKDEYIDGTQIKEYSVAVNSVKMSVGDIKRLENSAFLERFRNWIAFSDTLPEMPTNCIPNGIEAVNGMMLDNDGKKGTYQIQIILNYTITGGY